MTAILRKLERARPYMRRLERLAPALYVLACAVATLHVERRSEPFEPAHVWPGTLEFPENCRHSRTPPLYHGAFAELSLIGAACPGPAEALYLSAPLVPGAVF